MNTPTQFPAHKAGNIVAVLLLLMAPLLDAWATLTLSLCALAGLIVASKGPERTSGIITAAVAVLVALAMVSAVRLFR